MERRCFFSPLSLWERGVRGVRASEGMPVLRYARPAGNRA